jgi:hypothetical protein
MNKKIKKKKRKMSSCGMELSMKELTSKSLTKKQSKQTDKRLHLEVQRNIKSCVCAFF